MEGPRGAGKELEDVGSALAGLPETAQLCAAYPLCQLADGGGTGLAGGAEGEAEWKNPGDGGWFQVSRSHKCGPSDIYSIRNMVTVWQGNALGYAGRCFAPAVKSDSVLPESIAGSGWGWILAVL